MLKLNYDAVHRFVQGHKSAYWDGWTMVIWKETPAGASSPLGLRRDGKWGIAKRVDPDHNGLWNFRV